MRYFILQSISIENRPIVLKMAELPENGVRILSKLYSKLMLTLDSMILRTWAKNYYIEILEEYVTVLQSLICKFSDNFL